MALTHLIFAAAGQLSPKIALLHGSQKTSGGKNVEILWENTAMDPGWCKLDWIVADPVRKQLVNASNMLDVTWESPDGEVVPLDGYLDGYFQ